VTTRKSNLSSSGRVASCASRTPIQRRHFACASIALGGAPSHASISSRSFRSAGRPACQSRALRWLTRINANQVRKWIVQHRAGRLSPNADVLPAPVLAKSESELNRASRCSAGVIEIELDRAHIRVRGAAVARNAASVAGGPIALLLASSRLYQSFAARALCYWQVAIIGGFVYLLLLQAGVFPA